MKNLKKIAFLLIASVLIVNCSSDDDTSDVQNMGGGNGNGNANLRSTGDSAEELLRSTDFDNLVIEAIYLNGIRPENSSLNNLRSFLEERLNKPGGITIIERELDVPDVDDYEVNEIDDIEQDNRTRFTNDRTIAVSVIFADKPNERDEGNSVVLGVAYRNTSLVMFQQTIERFSGGLNQPSREVLETTVYNHEFAHLMGLVNLGTPLQSDHEDDENENHCNVDGCLMFFEINGGNILNMMGVNNVPTLDDQCLADLRANGGK
jgi:hypothetical protein